jgi:hypothetical protein
MSAHTPGPWAVRVEFGVSCIRPADYKSKGYGSGYAPIAKVIGDKRIGQQEANACLIAAAPRMFDRVYKLAEDGDAEAISIMEEVNGNA